MKTVAFMIAAAASLSVCVSEAIAQPPASGTDAAMTALLSVCRPAAVQDQPASVFAERLGYAPDAQLPPGLPLVAEGARSWRAPAPVGEIHVISGAVGDPAQKGACMVAVYGDPVVGLESRLTARLTQSDIGFKRDAQENFKTDRFVMTHYEDHQGYLARNVMVARALTPTADHPTLTIIAYRVDYSWLRSASH